MEHLFILLLCGFLCSCNALLLFARTSTSLSLLDVDLSHSQLQITAQIENVSIDVLIGLTVDVSNNRGFYTHNNKLYSINFLDNAVQFLGTFSTGFEDQITSMAYDWITDSMYISYPGFDYDLTARIAVCSLKNISECSVIIHENLEDVNSLALNPLDGNMFWSNGVRFQVEKSSMNGKDKESNPFANFNNRSDANSAISSLSIDHSNNRLFFLRRENSVSQIWNCDMHIGESCSYEEVSIQILEVQVYEGQLLFTNYQSQLFKCNVGSCAQTAIEIISATSVESFTIVDKIMQPKRKNPDPCANNNGGCSHFCILTNFQPWRSCRCPNGIRLLDDGQKCHDQGTDKVLFITSVNGLAMIPLETPDFTPRLLHQGDSKHIANKFYGVDYDPVNSEVYWIDGNINMIRKAGKEATFINDVIAVSKNTKSFVLDHTTRNIYWIEPNLHHLYVTSLKTNKTAMFYSFKTLSSHALALDISHRKIYFTESHTNSVTIESISLDGRDLNLVAHIPASSVVKSLEIIPSKKMIFWTDENTPTLNALFTNGSDAANWEVNNPPIPQPFALTHVGDMLYCSASGGREIHRFDLKENERPRFTFDSPIYGLVSMKGASFHEELVPQYLACDYKNGDCEHICTTGQEKKCLCSDDFDLQEDGKSCKKSENFALLMSDGPNADVFKVSLTSRKQTAKHLGLFRKTSNPVAIDYDHVSNQIYVAAVGESTGLIMRSTLNSSLQEVVLSGNSALGINSMALDIRAKNIYWTNSIRKTIEVSDYSGQFRKTIAWSDINPAHIVVVPEIFSVFYVNVADNATIRRMSLSGDQFGGIDVGPKMDNVVTLAVDHSHKRLILVEYKENRSYVTSVNFDGVDREIFYIGDRHHPNSVAYYGDSLYFIDSRHREFGYFTKDRAHILQRDIDGSFLTIRGNSVFTGDGVCNLLGSPCSQICIPLSEKEHSCTCSDNLNYVKATGDCKPAEHIAIFSDASTFFVKQLQKNADSRVSWAENPSYFLNFYTDGEIASFTYDIVTNRLFWTQKSTGRNYIYTSQQESEPVRLEMPDSCSYYHSLTIDDIGRQLYASCRNDLGNNNIAVYRLTDGLEPLCYIGLVIDGLYRSEATQYPAEPRSLAILPLHNYLFYVDVSRQLQSPCIVQCNLNGKQCQVWLKYGIWPLTRLHADSAQLRLFYTSTTGVWSRDIGSSSSNIEHHYHSANAKEYDIAPVGQQQVFITELNDRGSIIIEKPSNNVVYNSASSILLNSFGPKSSFSEACRFSECSHMCRAVRDSKRKYECTCPIGFTMSSSDPNTCESIVQCKVWEFPCGDGRSCIHASRRCDGIAHCSDGSDESELFCRSSEYHWTCDNGRESIERTMFCNGRKDCSDASDEARCRCKNPELQFDCGANSYHNSSQCIERSSLCNGINDCDNRSDEDNKICSLFVNKDSLLSEPSILVYGIICIVAVFGVVLGCYISLARKKDSSQQQILPETIALQQRNIIPGVTGPFSGGTYVAYSGVDSVSSYPLPRPADLPSSHGSNCDYAAVPQLQPNRFYAPPNSAASMSTYGVVRPCEVRSQNWQSVADRLRMNTYGGHSLDSTGMSENTLPSVSRMPLPKRSSTPKKACRTHPRRGKRTNTVAESSIYGYSGNEIDDSTIFLQLPERECECFTDSSPVYL